MEGLASHAIAPARGDVRTPETWPMPPPPLSETGDTEDSAILRGEGDDGFGAPGAREGVEQNERGAEAILASPQDLPRGRVGPTFDAQCAVRAGNQAASERCLLERERFPRRQPKERWAERREADFPDSPPPIEGMPKGSHSSEPEALSLEGRPIIGKGCHGYLHIARGEPDDETHSEDAVHGERETARRVRRHGPGRRGPVDTSYLGSPPRSAEHGRRARPASERGEWGQATDPPWRSPPCGAFISRCAYSPALMRIGQLG